MSIDTRISYNDLSFIIGSFEKRSTNGRYSPNKKLITVADVNPNTIAHEIGHYLDHKWAEEYFGGTIDRYLTDVIEVRFQTLPEGHKEWAMKFREFVHGNLVGKSDIWSEYTQQPREVFARFIDRFTQWTTGRKNLGDLSRRDDSFSESDFLTWVRLLQEKSYVDAKYPLRKNKD